MKILYLGDHDASGLDMIRDVTDRQDEFGRLICNKCKRVLEYCGVEWRCPEHLEG